MPIIFLLFILEDEIDNNSDEDIKISDEENFEYEDSELDDQLSENGNISDEYIDPNESNDIDSNISEDADENEKLSDLEEPVDHLEENVLDKICSDSESDGEAGLDSCLHIVGLHIYYELVFLFHIIGM